MLSYAEVYNALADKKKSVAKGQGLSTPMFYDWIQPIDKFFIQYGHMYVLSQRVYYMMNTIIFFDNLRT